MFVALCLAVALAIAQAPKTVDDLVGYIKTAIENKYKDGDVAASIQGMRLSNRLDAKTVNELQHLGAGPKTVTALKRLSEMSASLPVGAGPAAAAAPKPEPVLPPAPSAAEQKQIIEQVRENALNYTQTLPNYLCRQVTKRRVDPTGAGGWHDTDVIVERLSFFDQKENYKVIMVNNSMVTNNLQHDQLGGSTSSGEFGSILRAIFTPESRTEFSFDRWTGLHGRWQQVFTFHTGEPIYSIRHGDSKRTIVARAHGEVFIDRDNKMVTRIKLECEGIPSDFPIQSVTLDQVYDLADIGGQQYMLPLHSDVRSREGRYQSWNEVTYGGYQKFSSDASISFDTSDLPPEKLNEQKPKK
jgi:hypothetical protein